MNKVYIVFKIAKSTGRLMVDIVFANEADANAYAMQHANDTYYSYSYSERSVK